MADPPPAQDPPAQDMPAHAAARTLAARLGFTLPDACVAGVAANTALLDDHWARLRGYSPPAE